MEGDIVLDLDVTEVGPPFGQAELHHVPLLPPVDGDSKLEIKQISYLRLMVLKKKARYLKLSVTNIFNSYAPF